MPRGLTGVGKNKNRGVKRMKLCKECMIYNTCPYADLPKFECSYKIMDYEEDNEA